MSVHKQLLRACIELGYAQDPYGICFSSTVRWLEACLLGEEAIFLRRIENIISNDTLAFSVSEMKKKKGLNLTQNDIELLDILAFFDSLHLFQKPDKHPDLFQGHYNQVHTEALSLIASSDKIREAGGLIQIALNINNYLPKEARFAFFLNDLSRSIDALVLPPHKIIPVLLVNHDHAIGLTYNTKNGWSCMDINQFPPKPFSSKAIDALSDMIFKGFAFEDETNNSNTNKSININSVILLTKNDFYWPQLYDALERLKTESNSWITEQAALRGNTTDMLHTAASFGHSTVIAELGKYSVDWDKKNDEEQTPVHLAAFYGHSLVISELAKHPIDLNQVDSLGFAPIHAAAQQGHPSVATALAKFNADLNKKNNDGATAAVIAAYYGHNSVLIELAKYSADLNQPEYRGYSPAHLAAQQGHDLIIATLAAYHAELEMIDIYGFTPTHWAARKGHISVLTELAKHSVDLNRQTQKGATPAFLAAQYNQVEALEKLIDLGADCTIPHITAVGQMRKLGLSTNDDTIIAQMELYIEQKVPQRKSGFFNWPFFLSHNRSPLSVTPLEIAAIMGHEHIVNILSDHKSGFSLKIR